MTRIETLVLIHQSPRVLLAMKKQRFGAEHYNGFGGGLEGEETLINCAIRETREEAGITIKSPKYIGKILFKFLESEEQDHEVNIYTTTSFEGTPEETEEMKPIWVMEQEIPYDEIWPADRYFIPQCLAGKKIKGEVHFKKKGVAYQKIEEVESLE